MSKVRRPTAMDSASSLAASLLGFALSIPTSVLIARAVGPSGKGVVTLVGSVVAQTIVLSLGVEGALIRYGGSNQFATRDLAGASLGIAAWIGPLGALLATAIFGTLFAQTIPAEFEGVAYMATIAIPVLLASGYLQSLMVATGRIIEVSGIGLLHAVLSLVVAGSVFLLGWGVRGILSLNVAVIVLVAAIVCAICFRTGILPARNPWAWPLKRQLIGYGLRGHIGSVFQSLNNRFDFFVLGVTLPASALGIYSVSVTATEVLLLIPTFIGSIVAQRAASESNEAATLFTLRATRLTSTAMVLAGIALFLVAAPLINVLFGPAFSRAVRPIGILLPGMWALGLWKNITNDFLGRGVPQYKSYTAAAAFVVTVVANLLLVPAFGINGAALASTIAYSTAFVSAAVIFCRTTNSTPIQLMVPARGDLTEMRKSVLYSLDYLRERRGQGH